jgi:hypothetical protein
MWVEIIQWASDQWVELVATGGVTVASIKWFVVDRITLAKKNLELGNFKGIIQQVDTDVKSVSKILYDKFEGFQSQLKEYEGKVDAVTQENAVLANLLVQTLTVANIPVEAKQKFYEGLMQTVKINDAIKDSLHTVIEKQKQVQENLVVENTQNAEKLNEV